MDFPDGMRKIPGKALLLVNSLNGSKQGAFDWNARAHQALIDIGLVQSIADPCLYYQWQNNELTMVALYVDDFRIMSDNHNTMNEIERLLCSQFKMKRAPENLWLGLNIIKKDGCITINAKQKIIDLLDAYGLRDCKTAITPAAPGTKLAPLTAGKPTENFPYREAVGSLLWLARTARPDILYAVSECAKHCHAYGDEHITAVKRVIRYLKHTMDKELTYRRSDSINLTLYVDANFAGEGSEGEHPMRSTTGAVLIIDNVGPIMAISKLQRTVATSTAEAEYSAIGSAVQATLIIINLLKELRLYSQQMLRIFNDNQAAIATYRQKTATSKLRHVLINYHFVRELIEQEKISIEYMETEQMIADMFTKALSRDAFERHSYNLF
jgi:hypothetical protein